MEVVALFYGSISLVWLWSLSQKIRAIESEILLIERALPPRAPKED